MLVIAPLRPQRGLLYKSNCILLLSLFEGCELMIKYKFYHGDPCSCLGGERKSGGGQNQKKKCMVGGCRMDGVSELGGRKTLKEIKDGGREGERAGGSSEHMPLCRVARPAKPAFKNSPFFAPEVAI